MRFAFYKGRGGGLLSKFIGWAIRWRTNGQFSHVEAVFPDFTADGKSLCFSSSEMDGGSRFKWIGVDNDPDWFVVDAPWLDADRCAIWCGREEGKPYDFRAIARFALNIPMKPNGIAFCSESQVLMCQAQGFFPDVDASKVSPQDFLYLVMGKVQK
jgi:hypothetical protein